MNNADLTLSDEARARLDEYLDAVERVLAENGLTRAERRSICDEVEAQACDMVSQRGSECATEQEMQAVLAELDDPEAYREQADSREQQNATADRMTEAKMHPFALASLILPASGVLVLFSSVGPKGEVAALTFLGIVTLVSITFAVLAIREIRLHPDRYFGIATSVLGVVAIPLLIFNVFAIFNVGEIDPWGIARVRYKLQRIEFHDYLRRVQMVQQGASVQTAPPMLERVRPIPLTEYEVWVADHVLALDIFNHVVVIGLSAAISILVFIGLYRLCRPKVGRSANEMRPNGAKVC